MNRQGTKIKYLSVYEPTGDIYVRKTFKRLGIPPLDANTHEKTIGRAQAAAEAMILRHKNEALGINDDHVFGKKKAKPFRRAANWVLKHKTPHMRATTRAHHKYYLRRLKAKWGKKDIDLITVAAFNQWITKLRRKGDRDTFEDFSKHMNLVMRAAHNDMRDASQKPYASELVKFPNPDHGRRATGNERVYSEKEIKRLWRHMGETTRDQFVLSYEGMMRLREMLRLTWDRVNLRTGKVTLRAIDVKTGSKTGVGREFILGAHALSRLRLRKARMRGVSPYIFPARANPNSPQWDNKKAWALTKKRAKFKGKATWHALRHTALTRALLEKRLDPIAVSEYCGTSLATLQRKYLHSKAEHTRDVAGALEIEE